MRRDTVGRSLGSLASRQAEAARRATTGERVGAPSADPAAAAELVRVAAAQQRTEAFRQSVAAVRSEAELAEGALGEAGTLFQRARELALQGANGGLSASDRASIAGEIGLLRRHLVSLGNTRGPSGFVFGGTKLDSAPF
ncbi:MAG: flagellar hook-associated protein 3, partial [Deltaproteobacteria bacterium]|nr:flagellar hook-associated protein 3 [Deltaproteobacteria bacterium]